MAYIVGEAREQVTMFPQTLDEFIAADHLCRVIEAFVQRPDMAKLRFQRAEPAETGRPGCRRVDHNCLSFDDYRFFGLSGEHQYPTGY
jgi:hypothetical protein